MGANSSNSAADRRGNRRVRATDSLGRLPLSLRLRAILVQCSPIIGSDAWSHSKASHLIPPSLVLPAICEPREAAASLALEISAQKRSPSRLFGGNIQWSSASSARSAPSSTTCTRPLPRRPCARCRSGSARSRSRLVRDARASHCATRPCGRHLGQPFVPSPPTLEGSARRTTARQPMAVDVRHRYPCYSPRRASARRPIASGPHPHRPAWLTEGCRAACYGATPTSTAASSSRGQVMPAEAFSRSAAGAHRWQTRHSSPLHSTCLRTARRACAIPSPSASAHSDRQRRRPATRRTCSRSEFRYTRARPHAPLPVPCRRS